MDRGAPLPWGPERPADDSSCKWQPMFCKLWRCEGDLRGPRAGGIPASRFLGSLTSWGLGTGHASAPREGNGGRTPVAGETHR